MFVCLLLRTGSEIGPWTWHRAERQKPSVWSARRSQDRAGVRSLTAQASGPRRVRSSRSKSKRKHTRSDAANEDFEIVDVPLSNFSFLQADGSVDWDRLQTFSSRSWEETQTVIRSAASGVSEEDAEVAKSTDGTPLQYDNLALTLSREELQSPGKYERVTSLGALGILSRDVLPVPLDAETRSLRENERVHVTFTVSLERQGDAFVRGRVRTRFRNECCDRCAARLEMEIRNSFDVWMAAREDAVPNTEDGDPRTEEAIEPFHPGIESVDFSRHVRESIWLSIPYRVLCADQDVCRGRMEQMGWRFHGSQGQAVIQMNTSSERDALIAPEKDVVAQQLRSDHPNRQKDSSSMPLQPRSVTIGEPIAVDTRGMQSLAERNPKAAAALAELRKRLQLQDNQDASKEAKKLEDTTGSGPEA
ncbi:hypothetical protein F1559_002618 [Cyanidiococcus yangmingshanensis]|uniref:Uncharacterized protein n=1 Tax=Cyanidiococcus yangmingshanensis TaxID=2690220 RepID=A0A7J7IEK2_9RHOD|nr:hypothetical protein F1559_002618 [Cyanidiococcus yangmingshanensis]